MHPCVYGGAGTCEMLSVGAGSQTQAHLEMHAVCTLFLWYFDCTICLYNTHKHMSACCPHIRRWLTDPWNCNYRPLLAAMEGNPGPPQFT